MNHNARQHLNPTRTMGSIPFYESIFIFMNLHEHKNIYKNFIMINYVKN